MSTKRIYSWNRQIPDFRDFKFEGSTFLEKFFLPSSVDLRSVDGPIEDQGQLGSCTANALAGALQFLEKQSGKAVTLLSRLFIYYNERVIEGTVSIDSGSEIRDGIKTLNKQGVCTEKMWPYTISKFKTKPSTAAYKEALTDEITIYKALSTITDMKTALSQGLPFVFGFTVYSSFESTSVTKTGIVPMPKKNESVLGGHAVTAVGYDDSKQWFIVRNSWGTAWGDKGYFYLPYAYISNPNLASDFWVITK